MNDYLWDGSGEPDGDIASLEARLGTLRYQAPAKPLSLDQFPAAHRPHRANFFRLALAAAAAFLALGLGTWLWLGRSVESITVADTGVKASTELNWSEPPAPAPIVTAPSSNVAHDANAAPRSSVDYDQLRRSRVMARARVEDREGRSAAEQLLKALQITSDQLNYVRTQASQTGEQTPAS